MRLLGNERSQADGWQKEPGADGKTRAFAGSAIASTRIAWTQQAAPATSGETALMLSSGWVPERVVAPAWYGGAPSVVALHGGAVGLRVPGGRGRDPSRLEARGGLAGLWLTTCD